MMQPRTPAQAQPLGWFAVFITMALAFGTYFCMYAFRKPFAAGSYHGEGLSILGVHLELKTILVISQIIGYAISKYAGIRICSETKRSYRAIILVSLILMAEIALIVFAVLPNSLAPIALFCNGLPLGMVWGLVVLYLEGRKSSELLLAGLSCSFIVASGIVKDIGRWLITDLGVTERWMPAVVGASFLLPFIVLVWFLDHTPDPNVLDQRERSPRTPMHRAQRRQFVRSLLPSLIPLLVMYFLCTAYRDYRDNYGVEIYEALLSQSDPTIFSRSELLVACGVLVALALVNLIKNNRIGLLVVHLLMAGGALLLTLSTLAFDSGSIDGVWWMILVGLGAYLCYVPFGSVLFDRTVAATRLQGNAVFAIYLADALGYTGSVGVQLYKDLFATDASRLEFFRAFTYVLSAISVAGVTMSAVYLWRRTSAKPMRSGSAGLDRSPVPRDRMTGSTRPRPDR